MDENIDKFIGHLRESLENGAFIKLILGNYNGTDPHLQKIQVRPIETKKGRRLYVLYRSDSRDTAKNFDIGAGLELIQQLIGTDFRAAHLFTTQNDMQLDIGRRASRLNISKPTLRSQGVEPHDREKRRLIDPDAFYLKALGVTSDSGEIRGRAQDKWRQINKFVEIVAGLVDRSSLKDARSIRILDMGSGKGYLTFATYDYFRNVRGLEPVVTGVEMRQDLVDRCNEIAEASDHEGLRFVQGSIADTDASEVDVLIALHACDTATDDALYKGIVSDAAVVVAAPCCHKELRPQIVPPDMLRDVLKHGIMLERTAEFLTDALRSMLLERSGYSVKLLDFVPVEHTPKNLMMVGTRDPRPGRTAELDREIELLFEFYSIKEQRLASLLESSKTALV